jgi:hypothetical protein
MTAEAKILTFCIGCGVLEELPLTPELMETIDINQVIETESCPHCLSRLRKITREYTKVPVYQVSQKGEWYPGRFDHWFCEKKQAWCIISLHCRNDDSRDELRRRFEEDRVLTQERSFPEHEQDDPENGCYSHHCKRCGKEFLAHKHYYNPVCRLCADTSELECALRLTGDRTT